MQPRSMPSRCANNLMKAGLTQNGARELPYSGKAMKTFVEEDMEFRLENIRVMDDVNGWRCVLCVCMLYDDMLCGGFSFVVWSQRAIGLDCALTPGPFQYLL